jgi:hypothetical protein
LKHAILNELLNYLAMQEFKMAESPASADPVSDDTDPESAERPAAMRRRRKKFAGELLQIPFMRRTLKVRQERSS